MFDLLHVIVTLVGWKGFKPPPINGIKLSIFFGTRTLVRTESGKSIATAGTKVPVPRKMKQTFLKQGLHNANFSPNVIKLNNFLERGL